MVKKIKYGKISAVVFLTVLIWVWADLALDEDYPVFGATLTVTRSNPRLWVSFNDASSVSIEEIVLKGPLHRIAQARRRIEKGEGLEFYFDPAQARMTEPGTADLELLPFLQRDKEIKRLGLTVEDCKPDRIAVNVRKLVERELEVRCIDENSNPVVAKVEPPKVDMFVPEDWTDLIAWVRLTRGAISQARSLPIDMKPYIELAEGQIRTAETAVKIRTPAQSLLNDETITTPRLGFALSDNLQGTYQVTVENLPDVMHDVRIKATPDAKREYENMRYHVILEVYDSDKDVQSGEPIRRKLIYNFPRESVRRGEIQLNQQQVEARFRLQPVAAAESGVGG
ncbi:MAG: hypothetical protein ACYS76_10195 [Planctomycetota bacterium]|jgi:hypothetical protein